MLEYEETSTKNPKPSITFEVAEPADDMEKNWKVTTISVVRVSYSFTFLFCLIVRCPAFLTPSWICVFKSYIVWEISCGSANRRTQHSCHSLWHGVDGLIWCYSLQYSSQDKASWDEGPRKLFYHLPFQKSSGTRQEQRRYAYTLHTCI